MAVQFKPKPGKPHIKIMEFIDGYSLGRTCGPFTSKEFVYICSVNPVIYKTPGEAARALHYGRKYI